VISLLVDQNFDDHIVDGLTRLLPDLDVLSVRDFGMERTSDPAILEFAANHGMVVLTHDISTMPPAAWARVAAGLPMPGVFVVADEMPVGQAVDELSIAIYCFSPEDCNWSVKYFPM
jgi:hypothetical protein